MKILPSDRSFSLIIRVSYAYVRFRLNGYIMFPIENSNGYIYIPNTPQANVDTLKFEIPTLDELANIKRYSTATVVAKPDNYEQELVNIDYKLFRKSEEKSIKLGIHIEECLDVDPEIVISMNINEEELIEEKEEEKPFVINMVIEEDYET